MIWTPAAVRMRDAIAHLIPEIDMARMVVAEAQVSPELIRFDASAALNWSNILQETDRQEKLEQLFQVVLGYYSDNSCLCGALEAFRVARTSRQEGPDDLHEGSGAIPFFWDKNSVSPLELVGRDDQLASAHQILERDGLLLVHGQPGVGKSSLLVTLVSQLQTDWVLQCSGEHLLTVHNMFQGLAKAVGRAAPFDTEIRDDERIDVKFLMHWVAQGISRQGRGVLAVDDLHLLDDVPRAIQSLEWVRHTSSALKIVLVSATTSERIRPQSQIHVEPLTATDCARLAENVTQRSVHRHTEAVLRATAGLPSRVLDFCRVLNELKSSIPDQYLVDEALRVYESDPSGRRYFRDRWWSRLNEGARMCLTLLAGLSELPADEESRRELLGLLDRMNVKDPSQTLDVLAETGLIKISATLSVLKGYRGIVDEIACDEWGPSKTRDVWQTLGQFLLRRRRYPEAIRALVRAGDYGGALKIASQYHEVIKSGGWSPQVAKALAIVLESRLADDAELGMTHQLLAEDAYLRGDCDGALEHLEDALEYPPPAVPEGFAVEVREARLRRRRAKLYVYLGRIDEAVQEFDRALAALPDNEHPDTLSTWARVISSRAAVDSLRGQFVQAITACRNASDRIARVRRGSLRSVAWDGADADLARAQAWLWADEGRAWQRQGFLSEAYHLSGLAYTAFRKIPYAYGEALSGMNLAHTLLKAGCPRLARQALDAAKEMGERTESTLVRVEAQIMLAKILIYEGALLEAVRILNDLDGEPSSAFSRNEAVTVDILRAEIRSRLKGPGSRSEAQELFTRSLETLVSQERFPEAISLLESSVPSRLPREERGRLAAEYTQRLSLTPIDADQERSWLMLTEFAERNDVAAPVVRRLWNRHYRDALRPEYAEAARRVRVVHTEDWRRWYAELQDR
jgi:tetratricopeptide (TPR) repeat protein